MVGRKREVRRGFEFENQIYLSRKPLFDSLFLHGRNLGFDRFNLPAQTRSVQGAINLSRRRSPPIALVIQPARFFGEIEVPERGLGHPKQGQLRIGHGLRSMVQK